MALIDHILHANNANMSEFLPYKYQGEIIGWIHKNRMNLIEPWPQAFQIGKERIELPADLADYHSRSAVLSKVTENWRSNKLLSGWRNELYPVTSHFRKKPLAEIERAACPVLGLRSWGVHMTGYVRKPDGLHIWVARRAKNKPNYPGMLDNTVAGGQPIGLSPLENIIKEAGEEAGIPKTMAHRIKPVGMLSYRHQVREGLKPDQMFCFDMELPDDFYPRNTDGEVDSFDLIHSMEVLEIIRTSRDFKYNCNLCLIDFFIRHSLVTPENEPDYADLNIGLKGHYPDSLHKT